MFGSSLPPIVCRRVHVVFRLFVFTSVWWCPTNIVLCFCLFFFVLCLFLGIVHFICVAHSVFFGVLRYEAICLRQIILHWIKSHNSGRTKAKTVKSKQIPQKTSRIIPLQFGGNWSRRSSLQATCTQQTGSTKTSV